MSINFDHIEFLGNIFVLIIRPMVAKLFEILSKIYTYVFCRMTDGPRIKRIFVGGENLHKQFQPSILNYIYVINGRIFRIIDKLRYY